MPMRGPRLLGCGCVSPPGTLCPHQQARAAERKAKADAARPTARERGYGTKWDKARAAFLRDRPLCERIVDGKGCCRPATVVHHVVPHRGDMRRFWDRSNWSPRCQPCHDRAEQAAERRDRGVGANFSQAVGTGAGSLRRERHEMSKTETDRSRGTDK